MQDVALHPIPPTFAVLCCPCPHCSMLPCTAISPTVFWSANWSYALYLPHCASNAVSLGSETTAASLGWDSTAISMPMANRSNAEERHHRFQWTTTSASSGQSVVLHSGVVPSPSPFPVGYSINNNNKKEKKTLPQTISLFSGTSKGADRQHKTEVCWRTPSPWWHP